MPLSPVPIVRRTAREREQRRIRILAMVQSGFSYEAIARDENLSRERVRQIVAQSLDEPEGAGRGSITPACSSPAWSRRCGSPRAASPMASCGRSTGC